MAPKPFFFSTKADCKGKRVTRELLNSVDWYSRRTYNGEGNHHYYNSDEDVNPWKGAPPTEEEDNEEKEEEGIGI